MHASAEIYEQRRESHARVRGVPYTFEMAKNTSVPTIANLMQISKPPIVRTNLSPSDQYVQFCVTRAADILSATKQALFSGMYIYDSRVWLVLESWM